MEQETIKQTDIKLHLVQHLTQAKEKIYLSIGWIADNGLIGLLQKRAIEGLVVKIILIKDSSNAIFKNDFYELTRKGVDITWLDPTEREILIDNKFVVIDDKIVINGNYNWRHKNPPQEEYINITSKLPTFAQGYIEEFDYLTVFNQLPKSDPKPLNNIGDLLKKMEVLKVLLSMGDTEFIHIRLNKLADFQHDTHVGRIYLLILEKEFEEALKAIKEFIQWHQPLLECIEPPIENLKREIQRLENEIASVSQEFNETQKVLNEFSKLHSEELGGLLQKILYQSKLKAEIEAKKAADDLEKQEDLAEAQKDHEEYTKSLEESKKQTYKSLTPQQQKELKKLYRQASLKCHPDRIVEELHHEAEAFFVELNTAYKSNDLERVKEIHQQLKSGMMLSKSESITEWKKLESTVQSLQQKLQDWNAKLDKLKAMPTYQTVSNIEDWMLYFAETKEVLKSQLERLNAFNQANKEAHKVQTE